MESNSAKLKDRKEVELAVPAAYIEQFTTCLQRIGPIMELMAIDQHCIHVDRLFLAHTVYIFYKADMDLQNEFVLESFVAGILLAHEIREIYSGQLRQQLLDLANANDGNVLKWRVELLRRCRFCISVDILLLEQIARINYNEPMWYRQRDVAAKRHLRWTAQSHQTT